MKLETEGPAIRDLMLEDVLRVSREMFSAKSEELVKQMLDTLKDQSPIHTLSSVSLLVGIVCTCGTTRIKVNDLPEKLLACIMSSVLNYIRQIKQDNINN